MNISQYALVILKPDALGQFLDNQLIDGFEDHGLYTVKRKVVTLSLVLVEDLYAEKKHYNYFPRLVDYLCSEQSMCLIVKSRENEDATKIAKEYRDLARINLKLKRFELTEHDVELLNQYIHPKQEEIAREMALQNLIHVVDNFEESSSSISKILNDWDMAELRNREPELYAYLHQARPKIDIQIRDELSLGRKSPKERL